MMSKKKRNKDYISFRRLADSSTDAYDEIYARYKGKLMSYIRLSFRFNDSITEEIVSETFITLWERREKAAKQENPVAWMFKVAKNIAIKVSRKERKHHADALDDEVIVLADRTPESQLEFKELQKEINAAAEALSPTEREVFFKSKMMDISHEQLAKELGVKNQTIRNRLSSALKKIRRILSNRNG